MRLFTGIDLPAEVRRNLVKLLTALRPHARLKWSPVENLHITTKFIGEWPPGRLEEMKSALAGIAPPGAIEIAVRDIGWFPNARNPRVFWAGIAAPPALSELARATEDVLERLGIAREDRPFSPHLTLARIKEPVPLDALRRAIEALPSTDFGKFTADRFHLYLSERGSSGASYTQLASYPLTRR